jgi:hypothetical protein
MYNSGGFLGIIFIVLIVAIAVLLILREFWCWYWKINKINSQLEEQNQLLRLLLTHFGVSGISAVSGVSVEDTPNSVDGGVPPIKEAINAEPKEISVKRAESTFGSALLVGVSIDNEIKFPLGNGDEKTIDMVNGKHTISAVFGENRVQKVFEIENNGKTFCINIGPPMIINEE